MALSSVVSEVFKVEKCRNLEIRIKGHSRSLKVVPFDRLCMMSYYCSTVSLSLRHTTHTHSVLIAIFPGEPGLAGCPLNSSPFIPGLRILLGQTKTFHVILNTIPPGLFWASSLTNSFNFPRYTTFDPVLSSFRP